MHEENGVKFYLSAGVKELVGENGKVRELYSLVLFCHLSCVPPPPPSLSPPPPPPSVSPPPPLSPSPPPLPPPPPPPSLPLINTAKHPNLVCFHCTI